MDDGPCLADKKIYFLTLLGGGLPLVYPSCSKVYTSVMVSISQCLHSASPNVGSVESHIRAYEVFQRKEWSDEQAGI